jgi:hypothetical protein
VVWGSFAALRISTRDSDAAQTPQFIRANQPTLKPELKGSGFFFRGKMIFAGMTEATASLFVSAVRIRYVAGGQIRWSFAVQCIQSLFRSNRLPRLGLAFTLKL